MHLCRYIDEQCFRYNYRKSTDLERFMIVVAQVVGKRITYAELTGKTGEKIRYEFEREHPELLRLLAQ